MTIEFTLSSNDYIQYYLHETHRKTLKKQIYKSQMLIGSILFAFSVFNFVKSDYFEGFSLLFILILAAIFIPRRVKNSNFSQILKSVESISSDNDIYKRCKLVFDDYMIESSDLDSTSYKKYDLKTCIEIVESKIGFYLFFSGSSFIIPKNNDINIENVRTELLNISNKFKIDFVDNSNWRWK